MKRPLCVALALSASACFYPAARGKQLETRVDELAAENAQLTAQLKETQAKLDESVPKIDQKIAEVTKALEGLDKASRRSGADIGIQLQKTVEDVAALRGSVDQYLHRIDELEQGLKTLSQSTDQKLTELKGAEAKAEAEAKKKLEELQRPSEPKPFLALAAEKAKAGDAGVAVKLYYEFLKKWPKDPLVPEAHYGIGEGLRAQDKCREALSEYGKVVQEFPKSKAAPEAWLHSAECFKVVKMDDKAKAALEELVQDYPKSEAAKAAKQKLAEMKKPAKKPTPAKKGKG